MEEQAKAADSKPVEGRPLTSQYPLSYVLAYLRLRHGNAILQATSEHLLALEAERDEWRQGYRVQKELTEPMQARIQEWEEAFAKQYAQLAAAEARATEAAAEAGKVAGLLVKAETELASLRDRLAQEQRVTAQQEGQMLALVQETHRWSEAEKRDKVRHQEEVDALKQELANWRKGMSPDAADMWGRIEALRAAKHAPARPAAPAPLAQQQQEGGGQ